MDDIIEKWRRVFGWETYIDDTVDEANLALKMETMANYILTLPYQDADVPVRSRIEKLIETCAFPIIFRVIKNNGSIGDIPLFYMELMEYFNQHRESIHDYQGHPHIDIEAELCASFSEDYVNKTRDPITPRKFVKPWEK